MRFVDYCKFNNFENKIHQIMQKLIYLFILSISFLSCKSEREIISESEDLNNIEQSKYDTNEEDIHYVLLISDNVEEEKEKIKSFNSNKEKDKRVSVLTLKTKDEKKINCLIVRRFEDLKNAKSYSSNIKAELDLENNRKLYEISPANYRKLLKNKDLEDYDKFYHNKD